MKDLIENPSAFPDPSRSREVAYAHTYNSGMSLRDYFAAKAMQSAITKGLGGNKHHYDAVAKNSYDIADAMLKARVKE